MYLFSDGPREYDFLLRILSLGRDRYWRNIIVSKAASGISDKSGKVLDIACGTGLVSFDFASSGNEVVGIDVTREMLTRAIALSHESSKRGCDVSFVQARAENLPLRSDYFDSATISLATRNVSSVMDTFSEMGRCVKPGGVILSMDFTRPASRIFRPFYHFYIFDVLPALGLVISRHWNGIFSYLASSILRSKSPEQLKEIMEEAGLGDAEIERMTQGTTAIVSAFKPSLKLSKSG